MTEKIPSGIHMPQPSFWPIVLAFSMLLMVAGVITTLVISLVGVVGLIAAVIGWALENRADEHGTASHG